MDQFYKYFTPDLCILSSFVNDSVSLPLRSWTRNKPMTIICHVPYSFQIKTQVLTCYSGLTHFCFCSVSGLVFTKGLRLSQVLGLNPVLKLRLLSQLSFVLKPYSQRVTWLSQRLSNNHSGFLCHVTYEL